MTHRSYISSALFGKSVIAVSVKKAVVFHLLNNKPEFDPMTYILSLIVPTQ